MGAEQLRVDPDPHPEHELIALGLGLDRLRRELRVGREEGNLRRDRAVGQRVEHDLCVCPEPDAPGLPGRQEDIHVDARDVEHGEHLAAGAQHLSDIGEPVLDASV
jgi:hypothetical protein